MCRNLNCLNQTTKHWYTEFHRRGSQRVAEVIDTVLPLRASASFAVDCTNLCCSDLELRIGAWLTFTFTPLRQ